MVEFEENHEITQEMVEAAAKAFEDQLPADFLEYYGGCSEEKAEAILEAAF